MIEEKRDRESKRESMKDGGTLREKKDMGRDAKSETKKPHSNQYLKELAP